MKVLQRRDKLGQVALSPATLCMLFQGQSGHAVKARVTLGGFFSQLCYDFLGDCANAYLRQQPFLKQLTPKCRISVMARQPASPADTLTPKIGA